MNNHIHMLVSPHNGNSARMNDICCAVIDISKMKPVRTEMVNHPAEYLWSIYRVNAQSERLHIVTPHAQYLALGGQGGQPADAYRELLKNDLKSELVDQIRDATNGNNVFGGSKFAVHVEAMIGRRVQRGSPGRPKKSTI